MDLGFLVDDVNVIAMMKACPRYEAQRKWVLVIYEWAFVNTNNICEKLTSK